MGDGEKTDEADKGNTEGDCNKLPPILALVGQEAQVIGEAGADKIDGYG